MCSYLLAGRRSPLTRDAILCEPEVSLVGKFRFFRVEPSVIESMVLNLGFLLPDVLLVRLHVWR